MAKQIRQVGRALLYALPLVVLALVFLVPLKQSRADFVDPFWANTSPSPECYCSNCPCEGPTE